MTVIDQGLHGRRVLIVSRRDTGHPDAEDTERYLHQIALRWVAWGTRVTWVVTRPPGAMAREVIAGIEVLRCGGPLGMYPRAALRLLWHRERFDAIVDCASRISFAVPMITGRRVPVVRVVHQVRQRASAERFSPAAALGRFLTGPLSRWSRGDRAVAALSASSRHELRRHLGFRGPIFVVPDGAPPALEVGSRWARSARLLAGVVTYQLGAERSRRSGTTQRRYARSDIATVVRFPAGVVPVPGALLRATDEVSVADGTISVLLNGCDEFDALGVLDRLGVEDARIRLANWDDLLLGPSGRPSLTEESHLGRMAHGTP
jgi:hypothetical protein